MAGRRGGPPGARPHLRPPTQPLRCAALKLVASTTTPPLGWSNRSADVPRPRSSSRPSKRERAETRSNIRELARLLHYTGRLDSSTRVIEGDGVPDAVSGAVRRRLACLPRGTRAALTAAAVLGVEFAWRAWRPWSASRPTTLRRHSTRRWVPAWWSNRAWPLPVRSGTGS